MAWGLLPAERLDGRGFIFLFWFCLFFPLSLLIISNARAERSKSISEDKWNLKDLWAKDFNTQTRIPQEVTAAPQSSRTWWTSKGVMKSTPQPQASLKDPSSSQAHVLNNLVCESKTPSQISLASSVLSLTWHHAQSPGLEADSVGETKVSKQHLPELWRAKGGTHTSVSDHIVRKIAFRANSSSKSTEPSPADKRQAPSPAALWPWERRAPLRHYRIPTYLRNSDVRGSPVSLPQLQSLQRSHLVNETLSRRPEILLASKFSLMLGTSPQAVYDAALLVQEPSVWNHLTNHFIVPTMPPHESQEDPAYTKFYFLFGQWCLHGWNPGAFWTHRRTSSSLEEYPTGEA